MPAEQRDLVATNRELRPRGIRVTTITFAVVTTLHQPRRMRTALWTL